MKRNINIDDRKVYYYKRIKIENENDDSKKIEIYSGTFKIQPNTRKINKLTVNIKLLSQTSFLNYYLTSSFNFMNKTTFNQNKPKYRLMNQCTLLLQQQQQHNHLEQNMVGCYFTIQITAYNDVKNVYKCDRIGVSSHNQVAVVTNHEYQIKIFCHGLTKNIYQFCIDDIYACTSSSTKQKHIIFVEKGDSINIKNQIFKQLDEIEYFLASQNC